MDKKIQELQKMVTDRKNRTRVVTATAVVAAIAVTGIVMTIVKTGKAKQ
jgi:hypothetical protein